MWRFCGLVTASLRHRPGTTKRDQAKVKAIAKIVHRASAPALARGGEAQSLERFLAELSIVASVGNKAIEAANGAR